MPLIALTFLKFPDLMIGDQTWRYPLVDSVLK